jgi:Reverse transcriptase (RNA-dependent DNA polymerase)
MYCVGGVLSPLLANLYLEDLDQAMEEEMAKRRRGGKWERVVYTRYADEMVILVDGYPQWQPHIAMIQRRLEQELRKVDIKINERRQRWWTLVTVGVLDLLGLISELGAIGSASDSYCGRR